MKILIVTAEISGVVAVGGIAEFVLGLATALVKRGHEVRVAIPAYAHVRARNDLRLTNDRLVTQLGVGASNVTTVHELDLECPGDGSLRLPVIIIGAHTHFASVRSDADIYQWPNHEPWIAFARSIIDLLQSSYWQPDVIHCQDSHAGLVPVYVKWSRRHDPDGPFSSTSTIVTVHNLLNQGIGAPALVSYAGLGAEWFDAEGFEYYGCANCLKAGLLSADCVSTVSATHAEEICESREFGFGLEGVLGRLKQEGKLTGIVNGIDQDRWQMSGVRYDGPDTLDGITRAKQSLRERLYAEWRWQVTDQPIIAFRSRWDQRKGVGLLPGCMDKILAKARMVMRVWGTPGESSGLRDLWEWFGKLAEERPDRFLCNPPGINSRDGAAAHYTVADFLLMPSMWEPCGLTQMECQRFGTVPIVRRTGGLADTVSEQKIPEFPSPNGFVFSETTAEAAAEAVDRAVEAFYDLRKRQELVQNVLSQQNGWDSRVDEYEALYTRAGGSKCKTDGEGFCP